MDFLNYQFCFFIQGAILSCIRSRDPGQDRPDPEKEKQNTSLICNCLQVFYVFAHDSWEIGRKYC